MLVLLPHIQIYILIIYNISEWNDIFLSYLKLMWPSSNYLYLSQITLSYFNLTLTTSVYLDLSYFTICVFCLVYINSRLFALSLNHVCLTIHYCIYICTTITLQFLIHVSLNGDRKEHVAHFLSASSLVSIYSVTWNLHNPVQTGSDQQCHL